MFLNNECLYIYVCYVRAYLLCLVFSSVRGLCQLCVVLGRPTRCSSISLYTLME